MKEIQRFEDLPLEDKIDIFIQEISAHEKEDEIYFLLALFTAYNNEGDLAERFNEYTIEQFIEVLNNKLISEDYDDEQEAWEIIIDTLGTDKIWDVIDNIDIYNQKYNRIKYLLEVLEMEVMEMFTKM